MEESRGTGAGGPARLAASIARTGARRLERAARSLTEASRSSAGPQGVAALPLAVARALADATTIEGAADAVLDELCRTSAWDAGAVWVSDPEGGRMRCLARRAAAAPAEPQDPLPEPRALGRGVPIDAARPLWVADGIAQDGAGAGAAIPLCAAGQVHGVIELRAREPRARDEALEGLLELVGSALGQFVRGKLADRSRLEERADAADRRRATEEMKLAIVESALDPIITMDDEGRILDFNSAAERTFGYARADVLDQRVGDVLVPPALRERHFESWRRFRETGEGSLIGKRVELTAMRSDGSELPVELSVNSFEVGERRLFTACVRDVTERREAEAQLRHLASLVASSDDAIIGHGLDGTITSWNAAAERLFGYSSEEAVGRPLDMLEPDGSRGSDVDARPAGGEREPSADRILRRIAKDGRMVHVSLRTSPVRDRRGRPTGAVTIARDVSESVATEARRAELEQQLHQSQKMEAVGRLASGIAHDFNNLLAVIINYANFLAEELGDDHPAREDLQRVRKAADSAVGLVRQLLLFSRKEAVEPQVVDVNQLVLGMKKLLMRTIGEDVQLETRLATDLALTKIDPGQLEQVLMNLAVNARDAMPTGGTLSIDTSNATVDEYLGRRHGTEPGAYVRITISDEGSGIPPEVLEHIFEPFFTTKAASEGTGLGLATVYAIVQAADGCITVQSELGAGTTFVILLPVCDDAESSDAPALDGPAPLGHGETVLLVEDEEDVRALARRILTANGYEVLTASSGNEALELIGDHEQRVDVLLSDVIMPKMSGQELVGWLRQSRPGIPTVFMSGYADPKIVTSAVDGSIVSFVQKPFTADTLLQQVRAALGRRPSPRGR